MSLKKPSKNPALGNLSRVMTACYNSIGDSRQNARDDAATETTFSNGGMNRDELFILTA